MSRPDFTAEDVKALREAAALLRAIADQTDDCGRFTLCAMHVESIAECIAAKKRRAGRLWFRPRRPAPEQHR